MTVASFILFVATGLQ